MTEEERTAMARNAMFVMIGLEIAAFLAFWLTQAFLHNPGLAFSLLIVGVLLGAGYYIYQIHKLRAKEDG
jgi:hypothetical protein